MLKNNVMTKPIASLADSAARVSFWAAAAFVVLLAALHIIEPEFDPSWRVISEYALGQYGWIMVAAFLSLAVSYVALFVAIKSQLRTLAGRIGLGSLLISALGLAMAAVFPTDPLTTSPEAATASGTLHTVGGTLGLAMTIAAVLVSWQLARQPAWFGARRSLWLAAGVAVACSVAFIVIAMIVVPSDGKFGPDVLIGWPGRVEIVAYCVWLMVVARQAMRVRKGKSV